MTPRRAQDSNLQAVSDPEFSRLLLHRPDTRHMAIGRVLETQSFSGSHFLAGRSGALPVYQSYFKLTFKNSLLKKLS